MDFGNIFGIKEQSHRSSRKLWCMGLLVDQDNCPLCHFQLVCPQYRGWYLAGTAAEGSPNHGKNKHKTNSRKPWVHGLLWSLLIDLPCVSVFTFAHGVLPASVTRAFGEEEAGGDPRRKTATSEWLAQPYHSTATTEHLVRVITNCTVQCTRLHTGAPPIAKVFHSCLLNQDLSNLRAGPCQRRQCFPRSKVTCLTLTLECL